MLTAVRRKHQEKKEREGRAASEEDPEEIKQEQGVVETDGEEEKEEIKEEKDIKLEDLNSVKKEEDDKKVKVLETSVRSMSL